MSLLEHIQHLSIEPRHEEDEYEYTSDFLEWFYYNMCKNSVHMIKPSSEYDNIRNQCIMLINVNNAKNYDDDTLRNYYENMKQWLLHNLSV